MAVIRAVAVLVAVVTLGGCTSAAAPDGPLEPAVEAELDSLFAEPVFLSRGDLPFIARSGDARVAWPLVDLLRFHQAGDRGPDVQAALETAIREGQDDTWVSFTDVLLADDVPAPPGYLVWKRAIFLASDPSWEPFFDDDADLDWREVSWGGVFRDGIPTLDDPLTVPASDGSWLPDDDIVFGVTVGSETRAYPRRVLEVHELVNDTLGGRRIALPYCTLCGVAVAYAAEGIEGVDGAVRFRTSGLLQRSNKLMYDEQTESLFDQFSGRGVSGPLRGTELEVLPLTVTTWQSWREQHPDTTILAEDPGTGRGYVADPLRGRDRNGPIFPVGARDERLPAQERVHGVISPRGQALAFPVEEVKAALADGATVTLGGLEARLDGGAIVVRPSDGGPDLPAREAFWFAWSQFHPDTLIWQGSAR